MSIEPDYHQLSRTVSCDKRPNTLADSIEIQFWIFNKHQIWTVQHTLQDLDFNQFKFSRWLHEHATRLRTATSTQYIWWLETNNVMSHISKCIGRMGEFVCSRNIDAATEQRTARPRKTHELWNTLSEV